jgi:PAS domain S-box-containing protein/putative nucleotidyltransferase with HDIG domain
MKPIKERMLPLQKHLHTRSQKILSLPKYSREEGHKAWILLVSGLILSIAGVIILLVQIYQTFHPFIEPAPMSDLGSDLFSFLAGLATIYLAKRKKLISASLLILSCLFLISLSLLVFGTHPYSNVSGILSLLLLVTMAMVLLKPHWSWLVFFITTVTLVIINLSLEERYLELLIPRTPKSQMVFSLLTWIVGGGIITFIVYSTNNILRKQAQRSEVQLEALQQQEKKLKVSEKRYRSIFEGVQDAILLENDQGKILDVNQRACELYGYDYDIFLTKTVPDIVSDQGTIIDSEYLRNHGGSIDNIESINKKSSGERFPVEFSAQLKTIDNQEIMVIVLRDITERKATEQAIQRQLKELAALHRISETGTQEINEDKIIKVATQVIDDILHPDSHGVMILDDEKKHLTIHPSYRNILPDFRESAIHLEKGITSEVVKTGETQYIPDVKKSSQYLEIFPDTRSELCVPIKSKQHILGVINIESKEIDAYNQNDRRLLLTLAGQLGTSIDRARLFNTVTQQVNRLQSLRKIDRAISSSFDLHVSLNIILDQITNQLSVDAACVLLLDHHTQSFQFVEGKGFHSPHSQETSLHLGIGLAGKVALNNAPIYIPNLNEKTEDLERNSLIDDEHFVFYYGIPLASKGKPQGVLELFHRSPKSITTNWENFAETLSRQAAIAIDNALLFNELQQTILEISQAYDSTLEGWAKALELRDHDTEGHSQRVSDLTILLARKLGVPEKKLPHIWRGALLHDIGKMAIPDDILQKAGPLSDQEWEIIKKHPLYAKEMLETVLYLKKSLDIPLYHHERWDGKGYPKGLKGERIPLPARIFAVVDVWDALTSDRPYRKAWSKTKALAHIKEQSGKHFDPQVVEVFLNLIEIEE